MKDYVLKTSNLTKTYNSTNVLQDVSVSLEAGKIYGLIGQNGAGKSTFMRIAAGLVFPTKGDIELFGKCGERDLQAERKRLGCMIEYPSLIPYMTALENLTYHRVIRGIPRTSIENELLELVGLKDTGKKKAKNFSLGMKQRLGIAIALLGDPELLILDEPINGLDPLGVVEIRNLLNKLCEERNMTILISSHNLPELYQVATNYIIIHHGIIKKTINQTELEENCKHHILIGCDQPEKLVSVLEMQLGTSNYKVMPDKTVKLYDYLDDKELVARTIFDNGIVITNYCIQGDTLENYFISVIGGDRNV
ncbi:ABC transporter ATP-binding protein [Pseudobacteroides cellulosolvens]|uniref:Phosphonate-transporting ATPase n=1 Tax=Pseudobacteroides cellulosolvens ATCC 35603 = DSM 2933 TaxID=398512 RepID=A0A0L6JKQ3_9FIRM|nr:ATP-binding cassette domain-containing protein [Pseudobacteroides cellulosolvens]KNY25962.1 Phosphonate-transporting ATPase [Pseudobacteroides cellulosolvens ATCC 35603 = DSM 2933]